MDSAPIDVSTCINIVTKIVSNLSQGITKKSSRSIRYFRHIDIELIPRDKFCWVQVTNNGETKVSLKEVLTLDFHDPGLDGKLLGEVLLKQSEHHQATIYETHFNGLLTELTGEIPRDNQFSHLKNCLSIKIQHPFDIKAVRLLVDKVMDYLNTLQVLYPQTKYTLRSDKETFYNNFTDLDDDYAKAEILSSALGTIVEQSLNESFRREVCQLLDMDDPSDASSSIMCHLLPLLHKNYQL